MQNRIKELRERKQWSMRELASRVGTTSSTINKLEKGITRLNTDWLSKLAVALDVEISELVSTSSLETELTQKDDVEFHDDDHAVVSGSADNPLTKDEYEKRASKQHTYIVRTNVLDQIGIFPDTLVIIDTDPEIIKDIKSGSIVIAKLRDDNRERLVLRQFLSPSILAPNSSSELPPVINTRLHDAKIQGVVVASIKRHGPDSPQLPVPDYTRATWPASKIDTK